MMPLEKQVCSLELSKRLKELGFKQESLFYWYQIDENHALYKVHVKTKSKEGLKALKLGDLVYGRDPYEKMCGEFIHYSAFTVAELGEMLPSSVKDYYWKYEKNWYENCIQYQDDNFHIIAEINDKNEANARAKMLIYLLKNGLLKNDNT